MTKKKVFVIPGFKESVKSKGYLDLKKVLENKKLAVELFQIKWNYKSFNQWLSQFLDFYEKNKIENNIILGFSYGAMIAFKAATKLNPELLVLCSLSPSFKEDLPKFKRQWLQEIGDKRVKDFSELSCIKTANEIKCKTIFLIGEKEAKQYPMLKKRVEIAQKEIKKSILSWVPKAKHNIGQKEYLEAIEKIEF